MPPIDYLAKLVEILTFAGIGIAAYTRLMTRIKEIDMRTSSHDDRIRRMEETTEKNEQLIMEKLDQIKDDIFQLKIELHDKQDRN